MSTTTTDPRDRNPVAGLTGKLTEADSHFIATGSDRSYADDRGRVNVGAASCDSPSLSRSGC